MDNEETHADLIQVESIPPLPATAATLLAMAADPDVEIEGLVGVIERDPPLTARLLGTANSAFYAPRQPVTTIKSAIVNVLGLNMVKNIAFGMAVTGGLSTAGCPRFDITRYWVMALGTADLASGLARGASEPSALDPDRIYLSGLLHNIGELLLVHLWPAEANEALGRAEADPESRLIEHQRALMGIDRWLAGAFLARHWQLPGFVAESIARMGLADADADPATRLLCASRHWVASVVSGQPDTFRIAGVDASYCEYRSTSFLDRFDALDTLARSMA